MPTGGTYTHIQQILDRLGDDHIQDKKGRHTRACANRLFQPIQMQQAVAFGQRKRSITTSAYSYIFLPEECLKWCPFSVPGCDGYDGFVVIGSLPLVH